MDNRYGSFTVTGSIGTSDPTAEELNALVTAWPGRSSLLLATDCGGLTVLFAKNYNYQRVVGYVNTHLESEI